MPDDICTLSVPIFMRGLANLDKLLAIAAKHVEDHKIEPPALLTARLSPDMFTLTRQVQIACDTAKRTIARFAGVEAPSFADDESTFAHLAGRIEKTSAFIAGVKPDALAGAAERTIEMKMAGAIITLTGVEYLTRFALPNFYFHLATAYNICRHNGVVIGKRDYLGDLSSP
jgi:hypothetical protein